MAEKQSIEHRLGRRLGHAVRGMGPSERLASLGGLAVFVSLLLPWYTSPIEANLVQTGIGDFNFAIAALLVTMAAVISLAVNVGDGYRPPRPLSIGTLMILAGLWGSAIVVFEILDRPNFDFGGVHDSYDVTYGIFVALAGTAAVTVAGVRRRAREIIARHAAAQREAKEKPPPTEEPRKASAKG